MIKTSDKFRGFTLIELIVVIAIIGILATITVLGIGKYQTDTRDARRDSSAHVIAEALEKYYDQNGEYPSCSQLTGDGATVVDTTLPGVEQKTLVAPQATTGETNSIRCNAEGNILTINGPDFFEYQGDGSADCKDGGSCLSFTLKYKNESDKTIDTITSRRSTLLATSDLNLESNYVSFTSVSLDWSHVQNASSYTYQRAADSSFASGLVETKTSDDSADVSGLTKNTQYSFRVRATSTDGQVTPWSNVVTIKTLDLNSPSITSVATTTSTFKPVWTSVANATAYRLQYSTSSGFSDATTTTLDNLTSTSQLISGIVQGKLMYFRVYPLSSGVVGAASSTVSANTTVAAPSKPVMAATKTVDNTTSYTTTWSWTAGSTCATNTSMYYQVQYSYNASPTYTSSWTAASTSTSYALYTYEGYKYTVNVQARCRSNSTTTIVSAWSATSSASYSQPVTNAKNISWSASRGDASTINMFSSATCRSGAAPYGSVDDYSRDTIWTTGPNTGNTGWRVPGGYSYTGLWYPSIGVYIPGGVMKNGWFFTARALIYCRNSVTGVQSPSGVSSQASGWTWGSNV